MLQEQEHILLKNDGTINLASSTNVNAPNIGMYAEEVQITPAPAPKTTLVTLENNGTIEGGDKNCWTLWT